MKNKGWRLVEKGKASEESGKYEEGISYYKKTGEANPFIKTVSENPVLWTGMKGASAESRKKADQMLKQVQHNMTVRFCPFCHPELVSGSRFWV